MFYYVQGPVAHIAPNLAVIDCGGVGYACNTTAYTLSALNVGKVSKLYTMPYVKEEIFELYGFASEQELAATINEESVTLEDVYEPYLMQLGFLTRTPRGRCVTPKAYEHLGLPIPGGGGMDQLTL